MRFEGRGDPRIRATHAKTLEISADATITERATCVVAVAARADAPAPLAGPVRITIAAGDEQAIVHADANPGWDPAGAAVIRRGPLRLPGTLATGADRAAAELPRELVVALQDPDAVVTITVEAVPTTHPTIVLFAADPTRPNDPRLGAEFAAADVVLAEDDAARALTGRTESHPATITGRLLVVATERRPGWSLGAARAGARVRTVGLAPQSAVAAAAPWAVPVVFGDVPDALLRSAPTGHAVVVDTDRRGLGGLLALAVRERASGAVVLARELADPVLLDPLVIDPQHGPDLAPAADTLAGAERIWCCFAPGPAGGLDPTVRRTISGLLADGVATKTAARALAELSGQTSRAAYDTVLALRTN